MHTKSVHERMDYQQFYAVGGCILLFMVLIPCFYWLTEIARTENMAEVALIMFMLIVLVIVTTGAYLLWQHIKKTRSYGSKDPQFDPEDPPPPYSVVALAPPPYDFCIQPPLLEEVVQSDTDICTQPPHLEEVAQSDTGT